MRQGRLFCFHVRCSLQLLNMKISVALFISMQLNFFQLKIKKMNKMQMRTIYFPMYYIIWQILQNSRKFFFYLSNYLTIHLYLYNFEFLQNLKGTEEEVPPIPTTELDPNREKTFILFTHVDRKNSYTAKHVISVKTKVKITAISMSILYGV